MFENCKVNGAILGYQDTPEIKRVLGDVKLAIF